MNPTHTYTNGNKYIYIYIYIYTHTQTHTKNLKTHSYKEKIITSEIQNHSNTCAHTPSIK